MKQSDRNRLLKAYEETRDRLIKSIEDSDCEIDIDGDVVDEIQGKGLAHVQNQLTKLNIRQLVLVCKAIEKVNSSGFGVCEECGTQIGVKRMEALPGVSTCVVCAEQMESIS